MKIEQIDKNFVVETKIEREGLTFFDIEEEPFRVYGLIREDGTRDEILPSLLGTSATCSVLTEKL